MKKDLEKILSAIKETKNLDIIEENLKKALELCENGEEVFEVYKTSIEKATLLENTLLKENFCKEYIDILQKENAKDYRLIYAIETLISIKKRNDEHYYDEYHELIKLTGEIHGGLITSFLKLKISLYYKIDIKQLLDPTFDLDKEIVNCKNKLINISEYINFNELSKQEKQYLLENFIQMSFLLAEKQKVGLKERAKLLITFLDFIASNTSNADKEKDSLFHASIYGYKALAYTILGEHERSYEFYKACCQDFEKKHTDTQYEKQLKEKFTEFLEKSITTLLRDGNYHVIYTYCEFGLILSKNLSNTYNDEENNPNILFLYVKYLLSLLRNENTEQAREELSKHCSIEKILAYHVFNTKFFIDNNQKALAKTLLKDINTLCKKYLPENKTQIMDESEQLYKQLLELEKKKISIKFMLCL